MKKDCLSQPLLEIAPALLAHNDHLFLADHYHPAESNLRAIIYAIPSLAESGAKHFFIEVPPQLAPFFDPAHPPADDRKSHPPKTLIRTLINTARDNGMTIHFADNLDNVKRAISLMKRSQHAKNPAEKQKLDDELLKERQEINRSAAEQINEVNGKTIGIFGATHLLGENNIVRMTSGTSAIIGLHPDAQQHAREKAHAAKDQKFGKYLIGEENACVYTQLDTAPLSHATPLAPLPTPPSPKRKDTLSPL